MEIYGTYDELCKEIEIYEECLSSYKSELRKLRRIMLRNGSPRMRLVSQIDGLPKGQGDKEPFINLAQRYLDIENRINDIEDILDLKREAKARIELRLNGLKGLDYQIVFKRDIEGKTLKQIADELKYSYDWIRERSAKLKRIKPTTNPQTA